MLYGVDLHPSFQAGISIQKIHAEGNSFIICKMSEGTDNTSYRGSIAWIEQAKQLGMLTLGYHYLSDGNPHGQAQVFVDALSNAGAPGCIDAENGSGDINNIRTFYDECKRLGAHIPFLYLPRWYWQKIGSPDLSGLPPLWSSHYPDMVAGTPQRNYARVPNSYWDGYGNLSVLLLQFSSAGYVAGVQPVDCNAFQGTVEQLASLLNISNATSPTQGVFMALNDAEQEELLGLVRTLDAQMRGQGAAGWQTFDGGTAESLTVVDYLRTANVQLNELKPAAPGVGIDEATLERVVAAAVADALKNLKLGSIS